MKLFLIYFFALFYYCKPEAIFTSPVRTVQLFTTINRVVERINEYITEQQGNLDHWEKLINEWKEEHTGYVEDEERTLSNPLKYVNFLKKLQNWWTFMVEKFKENRALDIIRTMKNESHVLWPVEDDMTGLMDSIINLQQLYGYQAKMLANGIFGDKFTNTSLSFDECFMMSERCIETFHYDLAVDWSTEAMKKYYIEEIDDDERLSKLHYYIALSTYIIGYPDVAMETITIYLKSNPGDVKGQELKKAIEKKLNKNHDENQIEWQKIKELCRKSSEELNSMSHPQLRCQYNHRNSYYLKIAPLKEELLSLDPKIILYRDVIKDSAIHSLKKEFSRNVDETEMKDENHYLQRTANFENIETEIINNIDHKIKDLTSMTMHLGEPLEISKFEFGGYSIENEKLIQNKKIYRKYGRRMVKVIIHLNDVEKGGLTIFPTLNLAIRAEKGTAVVWFMSTEKDQFNDLSSYANCPVLAGHKWVLTKWTNEKIAKRKWRRAD